MKELVATTVGSIDEFCNLITKVDCLAIQQDEFIRIKQNAMELGNFSSYESNGDIGGPYNS